jgi:ribonuclease P protein component
MRRDPIAPHSGIHCASIKGGAAPRGSTSPPLHCNETNLSTQANPPAAHARLPETDVHAQWAARAEVAAGEGPLAFDGGSLKRDERLRSPRAFAAVRAEGRTAHGATLILGWRNVAASHNQYGFVVGKRVGNAVTRNLVKRRLRAIIIEMQPNLCNGYAIVITAKAGAAARTFADLQHEVRSLLRRAKLWQPAPAPPASDPQEGSL